MYMAGSLFAINTEGYCAVTPSQRLVCVTHHVIFFDIEIMCRTFGSAIANEPSERRPSDGEAAAE